MSVEKEREIDSSQGVGSCNYRGQEVPLLSSQRTRKAGNLIQSEFKDLRTRNTDVQGQQKTDVSTQTREQIHPSSDFLIYANPLSVNRMVPICVDGDNFVTQLTDTNDNLFQKHPHRHTQK